MHPGLRPELAFVSLELALELKMALALADSPRTDCSLTEPEPEPELAVLLAAAAAGLDLAVARRRERRPRELRGAKQADRGWLSSCAGEGECRVQEYHWLLRLRWRSASRMSPRNTNMMIANPGAATDQPSRVVMPTSTPMLAIEKTNSRRLPTSKSVREPRLRISEGRRRRR
jgi:hypothetical protein